MMALRAAAYNDHSSQKGTEKLTWRLNVAENEQSSRSTSPQLCRALPVCIYYVALAVHVALYTDTSAQMCAAGDKNKSSQVGKEKKKRNG